MYCSNCGQLLENGMRFCTACGADVEDNCSAERQTAFADGRIETNAGNDFDAWISDESQTRENGIREVEREQDAVRGSRSGRGGDNKKMVILVVAAAVLLTLMTCVFVFLCHTCDVCGKRYFGFPNTMSRKTQDGTQTCSVCKECFGRCGDSGDTEQTTDVLLHGSEYAQTTEALTTTAQAQTTEMPTSQSVPDSNGIGALSEESVRLANVFLSNFSELGIRDIEKNDAQAILNFAVEHDLANYKDAKTLPDGEQFSAYNQAANSDVRYTTAVPAQVVRQKATRFFGTAPTDQSTLRYLYQDGYYYAPHGRDASYPQFTNVYAYTDNGDGTVTFWFKVFACQNVGTDGFPKKEDYKGLAGSKENNSGYTYCFSGKAHLQKADVGAGYAPYRVISIHSD